jgi:hypothetical protein
LKARKNLQRDISGQGKVQREDIAGKGSIKREPSRHNPIQADKD